MVRALEPISGLEVMMRRRGSGHLSNLTSGPSKLCMAMGISKNKTVQTCVWNLYALKLA